MQDSETYTPIGASETQALVEVRPAHGADNSGDPSQNLMKVNANLMILTWLAFGVMAYLLARFTWKPILKSLDLREKSIRRALDDAEKARQEAVRLDAQAKTVIAGAEVRSREIVDSAKEAASALAERVGHQAREQADALLTAARHEIQSEVVKARQQLRDECAGLSIAIATQLVAENMDTEKNRLMVARSIQEKRPL
jgi:F-type H+-transporting ATPase subunit b